ncbi:MAG TPA: DUF354 domain-containing protein [Phycisphaerae bacterium]|nr:DUF354 domain-containing protein [Phycisphaerae bacterium]
MRVLFDITHPAQVHFFKNVIRLLCEKGHQVVITTREKDVAISLLKALGMEHLCLSRGGAGLVGLAGELLQRYVRVLAVARSFQPDVMVAEAGVSIGLVGLLLGVPRVVFEASEHARLQQLLGLPFATLIFTDMTYQKHYGVRHRRFRGIWVHSHLAPQYFQPDPARLRRAGVAPDQPYIVLRTVAWSAAHDIGLPGLSQKELEDAVDRLSAFGRVLISSERSLPTSLQPFANPLPPEDMHHLLAMASLYVGEGGTMAAEAATLGTPSIYCNRLHTGYTVALEKRYHLLRSAGNLREGVRIAEDLLRRPNVRQEWQKRRRKLLDESEDVGKFMFDLIEQAAARRHTR